MQSCTLNQSNNFSLKRVYGISWRHCEVSYGTQLKWHNRLFSIIWLPVVHDLRKCEVKLIYNNHQLNHSKTKSKNILLVCRSFLRTTIYSSFKEIISISFLCNSKYNTAVMLVMYFFMISVNQQDIRFNSLAVNISSHIVQCVSLC